MEYAVLAWIYRSELSGVALCWTENLGYVILKITVDEDTFENEARFLRKLSHGDQHFTVQLLEEIAAPEVNAYCLVFPFLDTFDQWRKLPSQERNVNVKSCFHQLLQVKINDFKTQFIPTGTLLCS